MGWMGLGCLERGDVQPHTFGSHECYKDNFFWVLKSIFSFLPPMLSFPLQSQMFILVTCMSIHNEHNFIRLTSKKKKNFIRLVTIYFIYMIMRIIYIDYAENDNEGIKEGVELLAMLIKEWFTKCIKSEKRITNTIWNACHWCFFKCKFLWYTFLGTLFYI